MGRRGGHGSRPCVPKHMVSLETPAQAQHRVGGWTDGWMDGRMQRSEIPSLAAAPPKGPGCGSALLFPKGMGRPTPSPEGASPAPPAARLPLLAHPPALSMPASSRFPSYLNTALFLAAGNPSWADNTPLESDLKSFLFFFLMLEVRKASIFSFSPGGGEIAAGSPMPGRTHGQQAAAGVLRWAARTDPLA